MCSAEANGYTNRRLAKLQLPKVTVWDSLTCVSFPLVRKCYLPPHEIAFPCFGGGTYLSETTTMLRLISWLHGIQNLKTSVARGRHIAWPER